MVSKKLKLTRNTLVRLDAPNLATVVGGYANTTIVLPTKMTCTATTTQLK
jgi:hypothetical protein